MAPVRNRPKLVIGMTFDPLSSSLLLLAAWMALGFAGLVRPASTFVVGRVLFPLGALVGLALAIVAIISIEAPVDRVVLAAGLPDLPFHMRRDALSNVFLLLLGGASAGVS